MRKLLFISFLLIITVASASGQRNKLANRVALRYDRQPGWYNNPEIGYGLGLAIIDVPYSNHLLNATNVTGYQFSQNAKIGVGYGVMSHNKGTLFPVYVDVRVAPGLELWVPYLETQGGVAMSFTDFNNESRIIFSVSGGVRRLIARQVSLNLSLGVLSQAGGTEHRSSFFTIKAGVEYKVRKKKY